MAINYTPKTWTNGSGTPLSAANISYIDQGVKAACDRLDNDVPFKFGIDDNGNYGYIKEGAATVIPFKPVPNPVIFNYTGGIQTYTIPKTGIYKLEV